MQIQLVIENERFTVGDKYIITSIGNANGYGLKNTVVNIWGFKKIDNGKTTLVGLHNSVYDKNWCNLNGEVLSGYGLWVNPLRFVNNFLSISREYEISTEFNFKNQNLKSRHCKVLCFYDKDHVFVEINKNVGGGSCDGVGKTGHCIILPYNNLRKIKPEINQKEN